MWQEQTVPPPGRRGGRGDPNMQGHRPIPRAYLGQGTNGYPQTIKQPAGKAASQHQRHGTSQQRRQPPVAAIAHTVLHQEIVHYMNMNLSSCKASHIEVLSIMRCLELSATKRWHSAKVELYGSRATGLYLASSDMDVTLLGVASQPKQVQEALKLIHDDLNGQKWVASMKLITSARIPVLKIKSTSGVPVDITVSDSTHHTGLRARDLIVRYLEEAPMLAPMVVVLKSFLRELGLNDPYTGGMSSYSLVVLLWNYLCEASHNGYTTADCGAIMVGFFTMFVNRFESGVTHVDDPLTPLPANGTTTIEPGQGDNILHSCYQIGRVCRSFRKALMVLTPGEGRTLDATEGPLLPRLFAEVAGSRSTHEVDSGMDPTGASTQTDARESPAAATAAAAVAAVAAGLYTLGGGEGSCRAETTEAPPSSPPSSNASSSSPVPTKMNAPSNAPSKVNVKLGPSAPVSPVRSAEDATASASSAAKDASAAVALACEQGDAVEERVVGA